MKKNRTRSTLTLAALLTGVFSLPGMALPDPTPTAQPMATPTPRPAKPLSKQAVALEVPFERQVEPRECGLAVLNMISAFYGQKLNQPQVDWLRTNSTAGKGVMASELVIVLSAAEFQTALFQGTLDDKSTGLFHHLDKHRPLIVMITAKDGETSHYDLVTGYDPADQRLILMDPAIGPVTTTNSEFEPAWKRANYFTLLAVPKELLAKTPTPSH